MPLPIDDVLPDVLATARRSSSLVVHAPTGAGKTTGLPPAFLEHFSGRTWVLEPRRIAARAAARFVAAQRRGSPGEEVGWHVRFESRFSARTRLLYLTDGMAVRRLQDDPFLDGVDVVVFDEFHERSAATDLALAIVRRVQRDVRPELRIVVMSATLDATRVATFLDGAPIIRSEGRSFPVEIRWADRPDTRHPVELAAASVRRALSEAPGDILCFLPGTGEIRGVTERLVDLAEVDVLPLHGELSPEAQDRALRRGLRRRVVLATNVAETSLTLDGITQVVDLGLARIARHDSGSGLDRLEVEPISQAAADQRAGRAGRQEPGIAWRTWTARSHAARPAQDTPELLRTDLAGPCLQLRAWGEPDPAAFPWVEAPPAPALAAAESLLARLGLVDGPSLTALGKRASELPVHPRLAVLVLEAARLGAARMGALAAAVLSERDPFLRGGPEEAVPPTTDSDLLDRVWALRGEHDPRLRRGVAGNLRQVADRLLAALGEVPPESGEANEVVRRAVAHAWPDRIACRRAPESNRARMVGGRGVILGPQSGVRVAQLFVALDVDDTPAREGTVRMASAVEEGWLPIVEEARTSWDPERRQVVCRAERRYRDLVVSARPAPLPEPAVVEAILAEVLRQEPDRTPVAEEPLASLLARLTHLALAWPDQVPPIQTALDEALPQVVRGRRGLDDLGPARWAEAVADTLPWSVRQLLESQAPDRLTVPSGSRLPLTWRRDGPPILAVRIQEIFGWTATPRVLGGRLPVVLHLLSPASRPVQVTDDLASFWKNTWPEVRRELRARYPKHAWPDDPLTAAPESRPRRRS